MEKLGLMERFANPELFESLTQGEKAVGGLITTLMGMGVTFIILFMLWGIIAFVSHLIQKGTPSPFVDRTIKSDNVPLVGKASLKEQEIIAVIAAAVVASCGEQLELKNMKITRVKESHKRNKWIKPKSGATFSVDSIDITI